MGIGWPTLTACNSKAPKSVTTDDSTKRYATIMVEFETPPFIVEMQDSIDQDDLYTEPDNDYYGIEHESHVTLALNLDNDIDLEQLKKHLMDISQYDALLTGVSVFESEKYDILVCNVKSDAMTTTHDKLVKVYEIETPFNSYVLHMTIAHLKNGRAKHYLGKQITTPIQMKARNFLFSHFDAEGNRRQIRF